MVATHIFIKPQKANILAEIPLYVSLDRNTFALEKSFLVPSLMLSLTEKGCLIFAIILFSGKFQGWKNIIVYVLHKTEIIKKMSIIILQCKSTEV